MAGPMPKATKPSNRTPPAKRLPTLAGIRLPGDGPYRELIGRLADSAQRVEDGADELAEAGGCLRAILQFIRRDSIASKAILPGPLTTLHAALHDLEQGAKPTLLAERSTGGKPTNLVSRDLVKSCVAAAYDQLVQGKINKKKASVWIAQECRRLGIWQTQGAITAQRIVRWRDELNSGRGIAAIQAVASFRSLRTKNERLGDPWQRAQVTLEVYAGWLMPSQSRETLPLSRKRPAASS